MQGLTGVAAIPVNVNLGLGGAEGSGVILPIPESQMGSAVSVPSDL